MIDEVMMLRHGRTQYNLAHRLQGQIDVPLDIVGQWQADQAGYALASRYYWAKVNRLAADLTPRIAQPGPDAAARTDIRQWQEAPAAARRMVVVSSDLFRAQQTAHAFADLLGLEVRLDARLRERSFGQWEGFTRAEIKAQDAEAYASWKRHTGGETRYGVESRAQVGERGAAAVRSLIREYDDSAIKDSAMKDRSDSEAGTRSAADAAASRNAAGVEPSGADDAAGIRTTLMLVGHGSWITAAIANLLELDPNGMNSLGGMRNACWCRLKVRHTVNGRPVSEPLFELEEYNKAPAIADVADWENGPAELRGPNMPDWRPIVW